MAQNISEAKSAGKEGAQILGYREAGGLIPLQDGRLGALKHNIHRYNHGSDKPWGREGGAYIEADIVPIGYLLEPPAREETVRVVSEYLRQQEVGIMPPEATVGIEVEGVTYEGNSTALTHAAGPLWPLEQNQHPELLAHVLETATGKTPEGGYPRTAVEAARAIAAAIQEGEEIAALQGKRVVYTSAPEAGDPQAAEITPHPYLLAFSPKVLDATVQHAGAIPGEVIEMYRQMGVDIIPALQSTGVLNWPVNALHVHNGVPQIDGMADPRSAYAMAQVRMTEMAKVMSFMLYNTGYCYGTDTGTKDVRSIMRRLLDTSHDSTLPPSAEEFISGAVAALEQGAVHSLPRYPAQGQHDRVRMRMDGDKKTMESIDGAMSPDLRVVLGWVYANQIMNTLALEALREVGGDESLVPAYLEKRYGPLMRQIPAMGDTSSYADDLLFNRDGYDAAVPWQQGQTMRGLAVQAGAIMQDVAVRYPALTLQADVVGHLITRQTAQNNGTVSLEEYLGIETGAYLPNGKNTGILTDAKDGDLERMIAVQYLATKLQADSLAAVTGDEELRAWFGLN